MNPQEFKQDVNGFAAVCCNEYMHVVYIKFHLEEDCDPSATIAVEDDYGRCWNIRMCGINGFIAIDVGDAGTLRADGHGLFCYLWHEASAELKECDK